MDSTNDFGSSNSGNGRRRPHRYSVQQTKTLEAYFMIDHHPNERERDQLGKEIGLTPTQIKFWFQNKRTQAKIQCNRLEGNAIKNASKMIKGDNLAMQEVLNNVVCMSCKGLSPKEEDNRRISNLKAENELLKAEYAKLSNILAQSGVPIQAIISLPTSSGSGPQIPQPDNGF